MRDVENKTYYFVYETLRVKLGQCPITATSIHHKSLVFYYDKIHATYGYDIIVIQ